MCERRRDSLFIHEKGKRKDVLIGSVALRFARDRLPFFHAVDSMWRRNAVG